MIDALQLVRLPYHLSTFTQAVARTALAHADELLATVEAVKAQRDRLVVELTDAGCAVAPSDANFVLFGRFTDQRVAWQGLLDAGVLVRDVGLPGWLRVTAGLPGEVDTFLAATRALLAEGTATLASPAEASGAPVPGGQASGGQVPGGQVPGGQAPAAQLPDTGKG